MATVRSFHTYSILSSNEVQLVRNEQVDILHVLTLLPPPRKDVPVLRGAHYHMTLGKMCVCVGGGDKVEVRGGGM